MPSFFMGVKFLWMTSIYSRAIGTRGELIDFKLPINSMRRVFTSNTTKRYLTRLLARENDETTVS